jgi:hypothetical protein
MQSRRFILQAFALHLLGAAADEDQARNALHTGLGYLACASILKDANHMSNT